MRRIFIILLVLFICTGLLYSERYEPMLGKSGSVIDFGGVRFPLGWEFYDMDGPAAADKSLFNFGIDFGIGLRTELQNRIDYNSNDDEWQGWTELLKFRLAETHSGPAIGFGLGVRVPLSSRENLGLIVGLYISSAIKDIDFDFNIGINPYITWKDISKYRETREHNVNLDLLLGKKILPFMKVSAGFEMLQYFGGKSMDIIGSSNEQTLGKGTGWIFLLGLRLKPKGYPILLDNSFKFGSGSRNTLTWQYQIGLQILPQSPNADW